MEHTRILGIELGSTRIKAVAIDQNHQPVASGDYTWQSRFENGIWTYPLEEALVGLKTALSGIEGRELISAAGISAMMHGYLVFDKNWNLLVPFRTWQNTITAEAAEKLTQLFSFNIPQRWSIAHLYQAILNNEPHVKDIAHLTTLSGYIHYRLTGVNAVGIGEASGMFPIDPDTLDYDQTCIDLFDDLVRDLPFTARNVLPAVLPAGANAGYLTAEGAAWIDNLLPVGIPLAPPEGDAGTGMVATNAVAPRTGNVSAGTSIFSMVVLENKLSRVYPEIDIVTTPAGRPVAMVHGNNCTNDMNTWVNVLGEAATLMGAGFSTGELFTKFYQKSLEGDTDCGGLLVYNYLAGEAVTHLYQGRPLVVRTPESKFTLANFLRAQLYATLATLRIGMDLIADEHIQIDSLTGHGGLFKTPGVGQRYMAAACNTPITCMETAGEGGPYGMALLAAYMLRKSHDEALEDYLRSKVFLQTNATTIAPDASDIEGFARFMEQYRKGLTIEAAAIESI